MKPSSLNKAVLCTPGKVGKPRIALKDEQPMAIQHVKNMFVWLPTDNGKYTYCMSLAYMVWLLIAIIRFT